MHKKPVQIRWATAQRRVYLLVNGKSDMMRARLIAVANLRWCLEQTPLRFRGTILAYEEIKRRKVVTSL